MKVNTKTTIALSRESRKTLQQIKLALEDKYKTFIDMDDVIRELIEQYNVPEQWKIEGFNKHLIFNIIRQVI